MAETDNLKLALPASNEYVDVEVLNENFRKIDTSVLLALAAAAPYSSEQTYALGDYCTHDGKLYRCTTAITEPEAWTAAHWAETSVSAELKAIYMTLQNKAASDHTHTPSSIGAYSTAETDALLTNKRNWKGGIVTGVSILDWAAAQSIPTDCACDTNTSDMPYAGYWMIQLCIHPEAGWKTLKATNILSGDTWSRNCNVSTWDAWRKLIDDTDTPASIGAAPAYTCGTEDLTAGVSALETGKLYFVYE